MKITIAHLLDPTANAAAKMLSRSCERYAEDPPLVLEEHTQINPAIPHLSHLHMDVSDDRIGEVHAALRRLIAERMQPAIKGHFQTIECKNRWLLWQAKSTLDLRLLHHQIVRTCAPLRQANMIVGWPESVEQRLMWQQFGYPNCDRCFEPHVTLSVLREPPPLKSDVVRAYAETSYPWSSNMLAIGELGPRGTMMKVLGRLPLY